MGIHSIMKEINTLDFIEALDHELNITHVVYVPCSYLKHLINGLINDGSIEMIIAANEAVATSIAMGIKMSGGTPLLMMQSSGFCNASSPLTSLVVPTDTHIMTLVSWRKVDDDSDDIQHSVLSDSLKNMVMSTGAEWFKELSIPQLWQSGKSTGICWVGPKAFTEVPSPKLSFDRPENKRSVYLKLLNDRYANKDIQFVATTGNTNNEMYEFCKDLDIFHMTGNMGGALSVGHGISLSGRRTIVCGGDSEFQMHLGGLITCRKDLPLTYIIFDNGVNKSTGGQETNRCALRNICQSIGFEVFSAINVVSFIDALMKIDLINYNSKKSNRNKTNIILVTCDLDPAYPRPPRQVTIDSAK